MAGIGLVIRTIGAGIAIAAAIAVAAQADNGRITVHGEGRAASVPDMATLSIGVSARDAAAEAAMEQAAVAMAAVRTRLTEIGIERRDMQTGVLSLQPRPDRESGEDAGFEARNGLEVTVRDLDLLGQALDAVLAEGVNELHGLRFGLNDLEPLTEEARRAAVEDARARAETYADAAGISLGRLINLRDEHVSNGPRPMLRMESAGDVGDSLSEGEVTVTARVTVDYGFR